MTETGLIYALRTFKGKKDDKQWFTADCLLDTPQSTPNFKGLNQITVFVEEKDYDRLKKDFTPLNPVALNATLMGNRVSYSLG